MRQCKNCKVEMLEDERMHKSVHVGGHATAGGTVLAIQGKAYFADRLFGIAPEDEIPLNTAVCPRCGLVENYLAPEHLKMVISALEKRMKNAKPEGHH